MTTQKGIKAYDFERMDEEFFGTVKEPPPKEMKYLTGDFSKGPTESHIEAMQKFHEDGTVPEEYLKIRTMVSRKLNDIGNETVKNVTTMTLNELE